MTPARAFSFFSFFTREKSKKADESGALIRCKSQDEHEGVC